MQCRREGDTNLVDIAQDDLFDCVVLEDFADDAAIASTNDEDFFRVRVACQWEMCDHLLVPICVVSQHIKQSCGGTHENSSRSVHWITPSSTRTLPYVSDSKTRTSWKRDFSTCRIFWTLSVIAWPGHWEEISRNQPSVGMGQPEAKWEGNVLTVDGRMG